jgi:very-short-patch-repair endonuclease
MKPRSSTRKSCKHSVPRPTASTIARAQGAKRTTPRRCANPILSPDNRSGRERQFLALWRMFAPDVPEPVEQHMFHPSRKWRFDFAWPEDRVSVEIEGGTFSRKKTAHKTGAGIQRDIEKGNAAVALGWRVLRYTAKDLDKRPGPMIRDVADEVKKGKSFVSDDLLTLGSYEASPGEVKLEYQGNIVKTMAAAMADHLKHHGADNVLMVEMFHETEGKLVLILQKARATPTPMQIIGELRGEIARLKGERQ